MPRGNHFTTEHQRNAALARTRTPNFLQHNQEIAPEGPAAQSAYHRARKGSALLDHWHAEFLFLDDYAKSLDQAEQFTEEQKRWLHGWHVWQAIWSGLNAPPKPSADEFLASQERVQARVGQGLALQDPFDIVYIAPDDFCNRKGSPLRRDKQRKAFRDAMTRAHAAAQTWSAEVARQRAEHSAQPRQGGQRAPIPQIRPSFTQTRQPARTYKHRHRII